MEERLEAAHMDQKRLFLIVFQRFIMILSEHLVRCDTDARDPDTHWYRSTVGRLRQVFLIVSIVPMGLLYTNLIKRLTASLSKAAASNLGGGAGVAGSYAYNQMDRHSKTVA